MEAFDLSAERTMVKADSPVGAFARRCLDLVAALALVLLLLPVMIAIAVAVRLDSRGPAMFRQRRVGYREREFTAFRFRSLRLDADEERRRQYVSAMIAADPAEAGADEGGESL